MTATPSFEQDALLAQLWVLDRSLQPAEFSPELCYRRAAILGEVATSDTIIGQSFNLDPHLAKPYVGSLPDGARLQMTTLFSSDASNNHVPRVSLVADAHLKSGDRRSVLALGLPVMLEQVEEPFLFGQMRDNKTLFSMRGVSSYYPLFGGNTDEGLAKYHDDVCEASDWVRRILRRQLRQSDVQ
ncbi:MAG TPA: hypothetical protein VLA92_03000 [Candidatus Saccharimonadales bacterium]|nr:hypothetical protein [Candidatus Saccharimonadales bacterium]